MIRFRVRIVSVEKLLEMRTWLTDHDMESNEMSMSGVLIMTFTNDDDALMFRLTWGEYLEQLSMPR
jgi:hypothetical protein